MSRVRTDWGALLTGGLIAAIFTVACARQGFYVSEPEALTSDSRVLWAAKMGLGYAGLFLLMHLMLRRAGLFSRTAYALAGIGAAIAAFLVSAEPAATAAMLGSGNFALSLAVPAVVGWLLGFIYHFRSGYETDHDDPHALEARLAYSEDARPDNPPRWNAGGAAKNTAKNTAKSFVTSDAAHVSTGPVEYYSGPLQVRTSFGTMAIAALAGSMIANFGAWVFMAARELQPKPRKTTFETELFLDWGLPKIPGFEPNLGPLTPYVESFVAVVGVGAMMSLVTAIPLAAVIYVCHLVARARKKTDYVSYALTGFIVPPVLGFMLFFVFVFVGMKIAFPCAIAMIVYRRLAGLEPRPVHEDIEVQDRRFLVGENHARRHYGRIIDKTRPPREGTISR